MKKRYILLLVMIVFVLGVLFEAYLNASERVLDEAHYLGKINVLMWDSWEALGDDDHREFNLLIRVHLNRYRIASQFVPEFLETDDMKNEICFSFLTSDQASWNRYKRMLVRDGLYEYVKDTISHCNYHYDI